MESDFSLSMKLPKIPNIELVALEGLERMGLFLGITNEKIGEARIIVNEAIINGFEHSGVENPYVNIEFMMTKEKLTVLVTDFGKGFDPGKIEVPEITKKIDGGGNSKRGWGIKLMKSLSDDLTIESGPTGTRITIIKNLT
jgi:anti-sigma regulatory factor (Ser/Thr protein kinase)